LTIEKIRVSIGSAAVLGLVENIKLKDPPTTCYIMTYKEGHCLANCGFCPQAREAKGSTERLSRVIWPVFPLKDFLTKLKYTAPLKKFKRICIQTLNYSRNIDDLEELILQIRKVSNIPFSVAIPPISKEKMNRLRILGVERVGIALDAATPELFNKIKGYNGGGPYKWEDHFRALKNALEIFSRYLVSTHLIVGLGETQKNLVELLYKLKKMGVLTSLFAFTPIKGTRLETYKKPDLLEYRKVQLARYLIYNEDKELKDFTFNLKGEIVKINITKSDLKFIVENTSAFETVGCPGCNRPYYTSKPSGPIYNYPRKLTPEEMEDIYTQLKMFVN